MKKHTTIELPKKARFLLEPHPFKVIHGGRGSAKTWSFARVLLSLAGQKKLFILCAREFQNSIKESVHKVLADQIVTLGWDDLFSVKETEIIALRTGSRFVFAGIRNNVQSIKSMEGIDIAAVFEANLVTKHSWDTLLPTVRRDPPHGPFGTGSEVWVEFNPELETDETYQRWVLNPPPGAVVVEMNWEDNHFFPAFSRMQMEAAYKKDPDDARTIWGGKTRKVLQGAIFAKELETAINEGRVAPHFKCDMTKPVDFSFDLGDSDMCCWWAWQQVGMEHNCIDYYGNTGYGIDHYLDEILARKYKVRRILLPHDASQAHQAARGNARGNTIEKQVRAVFPNSTRLVPRVSVANRINAARALFPRINFAEGPTSAGVQGLTHYQYKLDDRGQRSREPLHNWASNPADGFTYYAVALKEGTEDRPKRPLTEFDLAGGPQPHAQGWMG